MAAPELDANRLVHLGGRAGLRLGLFPARVSKQPSSGWRPLSTFNTAEGWSRDVSEEIAEELARRLALEDRDIVSTLEGFLDRHTSGRSAQLPLPLSTVRI
jgi:hypothetical protein